MRCSSGLPALGRVLLAGSLCLLAFAFAMEAKMAWYYCPVLRSVRDISAAKALPGDTPALAVQRTHLDHSVSPEAALPWIATFMAFHIAVAGPLAAAGAWDMRLLERTAVPVSSRPYFCPLLFFRPPPTLF